MPGGIGGTGVNCVFNTDASISVVISPLSHFMAASHLSPYPGTLQYGIMGNVTNIPAHFTLKTMLFFGVGINGAMRGWGELLRSVHSKGDILSAKARDLTLQYLGYTTDNGAYYYYNTVPGLNYEESMASVKKYADELSLPYKYLLLDSWYGVDN